MGRVSNGRNTGAVCISRFDDYPPYPSRGEVEAAAIGRVLPLRHDALEAQACRRQHGGRAAGHMCGTPATPPDDLGEGRKKIAVRAEPLKKLDASRSGIWVGA